MNIARIESIEGVFSRIDLSWKAKGIYAWINSNPECAGLNKASLVPLLRGIGKDGVGSINTALKELQAAGLIEWEGNVNKPTHGQNGKPGFIYSMYEPETGLHKIGSSNQPEQRAKSLGKVRSSTMKLLHTIPCRDMGHAERAFHEKYKHYRKGGEFFRLPSWAVAVIITQEVA